jgi:hypothetical protein
MPEQGNALSRNPNVCASCSSMSDGMETASLPENASFPRDAAEAAAEDQLQEHAAEPTNHHVPT